jgi:hypothetical protein
VLRHDRVVDIVLLLLLWGCLLRQLMRRRCYHEIEALFCSRQLGDVVFGVSTADVLLHGAVALLLWTYALLLRGLCGRKDVEQWQERCREEDRTGQESETERWREHEVMKTRI